MGLENDSKTLRMRTRLLRTRERHLEIGVRDEDWGEGVTLLSCLFG